MMSCEHTGFRADGLSIGALLHYGIPSTEVIECMVKDFDQQLLENQRQLEDSVLDIAQFSNQIAEGAEPFTHPVDAVNHLREHRLLDHDTCYDLNADAITKLLTHVLETLDSNPGYEDAILQELLQLSSIDGFALPFRQHASDDASGSMLSINTAVEQSENESSALWRKITIQLESCYLTRLDRLPADGNYSSQERLKCVQSLCTLFTPKKVWTKYRTLRQRQLSACFTGSGVTPRKQPTEVTFNRAVTRLEKSLPQIIAMMTEDVDIFACGVFSGVADVADAFNVVYQSPLLTEVDAAIDRLSSWKNRKASTPMIQKASDSSRFLGHLRGSLRRQSSSMENLPVTVEGDALSVPCLPPLARLVSCLTEFASRSHELLNLSVCTMSRKASTRRSLKSALKHCSTGFPRIDARPWFYPRSSDQGGPMIAAPSCESATSSFTVDNPASSWAWQESFARICQQVAPCIETAIKDSTDRMLAAEKAQMSQAQCLQTTSVSEELVASGRDYPMVVSDGLLSLVTEIDTLLPLATPGSEGVLQSMYSVYVDSVMASFQRIIEHITEIALQVTQTLPITQLYLLISNAAYMRNKVAHYDKATSPGGATGESPLAALHVQCCHLVENLSNKLIAYHNEALYTCVLHDAESHDWQANSHFYEDERCSFAVQMWHSYVCALKRDLHAVCPPASSRHVFSAVVRASLGIFATRYMAVVPSYRRVHQLRSDITAILLCAYQHLFVMSPSPAHFMKPLPSNQSDLLSAHAHCSTLLSILAIVTAPIEILYRVYKKAFPGKKSLEDEGSGHGHMTQWLSWIYPSLFLHEECSFTSLQTTSALYLQVRHLLLQPETNWGLFLQALLMRDCTLPIMLLVQVSKLVSDEVRESNTRGASIDIFKSFMDVLLNCSEFPTALSSVLIPVIERTDGWHLFEPKIIIGKTKTIPAWMEAIFQCLDPFIQRAVEPGLRLLANPVKSLPADQSLFTILTRLPCGCEITSPQQMDTHTSESRDMLSEVLYHIVIQLVEDVCSLPVPLLVFLRHANDSLTSKEMHAPHDCVGIKLLATGLRHRLLTASILSNEADDNRRMLAECLYHVLTASSYGKGSGTPRLAGNFMKTNRNWLSEQVDTIAEHMKHQLFDMPTCNPLDGATAEFTENSFESLASLIQSTSEGPGNLSKIHNFIERNAAWIEAQLDIPPLLGQKEGQTKVKLDLSSQPIETQQSNCLRDYNMIGSCKFDHTAIGEFEYNWDRLLRCDLGLTEVGFVTLLGHRHEMSPNADLKESEQKPTEGLRSRYLQMSP